MVMQCMVDAETVECWRRRRRRRRWRRRRRRRRRWRYVQVEEEVDILQDPRIRIEASSQGLHGP
jgi:hypothetical protein